MLNVCYADERDKPIKQELDAELQAAFSRLQEEARTTEAAIGTPWAFKGFRLYMQPKGSPGQWKWILTCPAVSLAISRGLLSPIIAQVRLSSEYLWSCETVADAIVEIELLLSDLFGESLWVQVSEVDLCADVTGWDVARCDWQERFVSRAVGQNGRPADAPVEGPDVARLRRKQVATLDFGKHASPISCCIYHKSAEIRQKSPSKAWFYDLWKRNGWDGSSEVWRVEYRQTREFLHSIQIEHVYDLPDRLAPHSVRRNRTHGSDFPPFFSAHGRDAIPNCGSSAFVVLSNKEKVARVGLPRGSIPIQCVKDIFLWKLSLNAILDWVLGRSIQWLSTRSAEEPELCVTTSGETSTS